MAALWLYQAIIAKAARFNHQKLQVNDPKDAQ
jgi:hypothetical protein